MNDSVAPARTRIGLWSIAFGFIAFMGVVGHFFTGPIDPPPPLEVSIAEKAAKIRNATVAALKGEDYQAEAVVRTRTIDDYLTYAFIALAGLAILLAVIGFVKREPLRAVAAGGALGLMAITFQFVMILFFVLVFVALSSVVIDQLDFSF